MSTNFERWERPRERLCHEGVEVLSLTELLALVLRTGAPGMPAQALGERYVC